MRLLTVFPVNDFPVFFNDKLLYVRLERIPGLTSANISVDLSKSSQV